MATITINGQTITTNGNNIIIRNGNVVVDGNVDAGGSVRCSKN